MVMNESDPEIKLSFVTGLKDIVRSEINRYPNLHLIREGANSSYLSCSEDFAIDFAAVRKLKSVARAYFVFRDKKYNPAYISKHKAILGDLIQVVLESKDKDVFQTFKLTCAGSNSKEARDINGYIEDTFKLVQKDEADLKIHIIKLENVWEVGVQITARPLSFRDYKVENMSGAMDPTIAYALNSLCGLEKAESYLNVFSGSATLLIEAAQCYPNIKTLIGFDNNKKHLSLAIRNIKKAELIKRIQVKEGDIFDKPDLGKFDVIAADLPFGMVISKDEDLEKIYKSFIEYCQVVLVKDGTLAVYTSEYQTFEKIISKSNFKIVKEVGLKLTTAVNSFLSPKIIICKFNE